MVYPIDFKSLAIDFIDGAMTTVTAAQNIGNAVIGMYNAMIAGKAKWDSLFGNSSSFDALAKDLEIVNDMLAGDLSRWRNTSTAKKTKDAKGLPG